MGWDSNPGYPLRYSSFQDCRLRPLGHPSELRRSFAKSVDRSRSNMITKLAITARRGPFLPDRGTPNELRAAPARNRQVAPNTGKASATPNALKRGSFSYYNPNATERCEKVVLSGVAEGYAAFAFHIPTICQIRRRLLNSHRGRRKMCSAGCGNRGGHNRTYRFSRLRIE